MNGAGSHPPEGFFDEHGDEPARIAVLDGPAIAGDLPELDYIVREIGLVAGGGAPHLLAGYGYSGKTVAAQSMMVSLAAGRSLWGKHKVTKRRVLHVDFEQGERLTRRRYQRLARAMGIDLHELLDDLALVVMPPMSLTAEHRSHWLDLMSGRDLILIDSLRAASSGQDENSSEIRAGLDMLGSLSEDSKCRAKVIHHARKMGPDDPGGRYAIRGSSAIFDGVDSAYLFTAAKGEPISVEQVKARSHGEPVQDWALVIADVPDNEENVRDPKWGLQVTLHGSELVTERRAAKAATQRKELAKRDAGMVRMALVRTPGLSTTSLRAAAGLSGDRLTAALAFLGSVVQVKEERKDGARAARCHYMAPSSEKVDEGG